MNIVLIGMRGTGKTTIGKLLAHKLMRPFFETDAIVQKKADDTIKNLVRTKGWEYFRNLESEVVAGVAKNRNCVIATGGGVILNPESTKALKKHGALFLLTADTETMLRRIGGDPNRPSLSGSRSPKEDIEATWKKRENLYFDAADEVLDTAVASEEELVKKIIHIVKEKYAN